MLYFIHLLVNTGIALFTIKGKDQIAVSLYVPDTAQNQQKKGGPGCPLFPQIIYTPNDSAHMLC